MPTHKNLFGRPVTAGTAELQIRLRAPGPPEKTERTLGGERYNRASADKTTRTRPAQAVTEPERAATRDYEAPALQAAPHSSQEGFRVNRP
jgi:hypothetical protein